MTVRIGTSGTVTTPAGNVAKNASKNEAQGFDSLWWPDHLMGWHPDGIFKPEFGDLARVQPNGHVYLDAVVAMTLAASATEDALLGTAVTEPIRRHPAMLAQAFLSLHHASDGRAILGVGAGEIENIEPYGLSFGKPVSRLTEALDVVRTLWEADGPVDLDGDFYTLRDAVLGLGPVEIDDRPAFPPIWIAAHGPRMLELTGRVGDGWIPTFLPLDAYAEGLGRIRRSATEAGRDPDGIEAGMWGYAVCDETHELCHTALRSPLVKAMTLIAASTAFTRHGAQHPLGSDFYGLTDYIPTRLGAADAIAAVEAIPDDVVHDYILHGTPDELAARVRSYAEVGLRHFIPWNITFYGDISRLKPSFDAFAELARLVHEIKT